MLRAERAKVVNCILAVMKKILISEKRMNCGSEVKASSAVSYWPTIKV